MKQQATKPPRGETANAAGVPGQKKGAARGETKLQRIFRARPFLQGMAAVLTNAHLTGFFTGRIWQGKSKTLCVPGLNCYSCPGAVGACPIGALQAVLGGTKHDFSYYVVGLLLLFGVVCGRLICGFLCPFGWIQELLYRLKTRKWTLPRKLDRALRWLKYAMLAVFVVALPLLLTDAYGIGLPYFCKWVCPAGTLEGGIPLLLKNESLRAMVGFLFSWKMGILVVVLAASVLLYRPFCKYLCPLGAFYALFNKLSFYKMHVDTNKCTHCMACEHACKMQVEVTRDINSAECIRCGDCVRACHFDAIRAGFTLRPDAAPAPAAPKKSGD